MNPDVSVYNRFRRFLRPWKSKQYLTWLKAKFPNHDLHHALGSMGALKLSDSLMIPLTREQHEEAHKAPGCFFEDNLHIAVNHLQNYITYLENENERIREENRI